MNLLLFSVFFLIIVRSNYYNVFDLLLENNRQKSMYFSCYCLNTMIKVMAELYEYLYLVLGQMVGLMILIKMRILRMYFKKSYTCFDSDFLC